jgi:16S rRNA (adenine1518-N6/adenine1519-N6)-dimethyltransferase
VEAQRHGVATGVLAGAERRQPARRIPSRSEPRGSEQERLRTFAIVDAAFNQRRKMLRQALSGLFGSSAEASAVLESAGVAPTARGEDLTVDDYHRIARAAPVA